MRKAFLVLLSLLVPVCAAHAERSVSLTEAINVALEQNPGLRALESSTRAKREEIGSARSRLLPKVIIEERYLRTNNPTLTFMSKLNQERFTAADFAIDSLNNPADVGDWQTSLSVEQPILAREANIGLSMAETEASAADLDMERRRESVAREVTRAYLNIRSSEGLVRAAGKGVEDALEHKRVARARLEAGLGLYSDTLRADVAVKEAQERLVRAEKALLVSKRALGLAMGLDEPVGIGEETLDLEPPDLGLCLEASAKRSDVRSLELRVENAMNGVRLAEASYLPVLGIGGSYQLNDHQSVFGAEGESYKVMAFLKWYVFEGNLRKHERARALHRREEAEERLSGLRKKVEFRVHEASLSVDEASGSLELARSRETLAEEAARLVRARYENSLSTIVDLLDAQARLDSARADVVAKAGEYHMSVAELAYQCGLILEVLGGGEKSATGGAL